MSRSLQPRLWLVGLLMSVLSMTPRLGHSQGSHLRQEDRPWTDAGAFKSGNRSPDCSVS
jgi:hypothetical protein